MQSSRSNHQIILAVSAKWFAYPERFHWLVEHDFALEYTPSADGFHLLPEHLDPFLEAGVRIRHHGFFPNYEFGDTDAERAERAMQVHFNALDTIIGRGEQFVTVHAGISKGISLHAERLTENLTRLVEYGQQRGITVSLENLRRGLTSHPENVRKFVEESGAMITLDVGHAVSCEHVQQGELTVFDFIDLFQNRLVEVHMYEKETDRHYAPQDMRILGPIVDRLLETDCAWWTMELEEYEDILRTRRLLIEYLESL